MPTINLLTPRQARAARAVLRLSVRELAARSQISDSSIRRLEEGDVTLDMRARLQTYYEAQGLDFWFCEGKEGVRWGAKAQSLASPLANATSDTSGSL